MSRAALFVLLAIAVAACGVKRPLIKPEDVPAYEAKRQQELQKREDERQQDIQKQQVLQPIQAH